MDSSLGMRLNGQRPGNEASTFADLSSFLPPLIDKYVLLTSFGRKRHHQQPAQLPLRVDDSYVAFDGTSCCLWLNKEPLARRVDETVAVGGVSVRILCECHLCVPQLVEEMWWRVWKRKVSSHPPSFSSFSLLPLFPFLPPLSHSIPPLQPSPFLLFSSIPSPSSSLLLFFSLPPSLPPSLLLQLTSPLPLGSISQSVKGLVSDPLTSS